MKGAFPGLTCAKCWGSRNQKEGPHPNLWWVCLVPSSLSWSKRGLGLQRALPPNYPCPHMPRPLPLQHTPFPCLIPSPSPFLVAMLCSHSNHLLLPEPEMAWG